MQQYKVKEIFYTLQGEGAQTGRPAVFCRFAGCNLWSGREEDRHKAICQFCDTDFRGTDGQNGGVFSADELAVRVKSFWPSSQEGMPYVVCTGGEPMLQLDEPLIRAFHEQGLEVAVETNGTLAVPPAVNWICVSPKAGTTLVQTTGQELKLVYPQAGLSPEYFGAMAFEHFYLQPMDTFAPNDYVQQCVAYCMQHPRWKLSLQTHKILGID